MKAVKNGETDILTLWTAAQRFAMKQAVRWRSVAMGQGVELEDLEQVAFVALLTTLDDWQQERGAFLTLYGLKLKAAFTEATGQRTVRQQKDPINYALSLDAPVADNDGEPFTIADILPDLSTEAAFENVGLQIAIRAAIETLSAEERNAIVGKFWIDRKADPKILRKALRNLRNPKNSKLLKEYL